MKLLDQFGRDLKATEDSMSVAETEAQAAFLNRIRALPLQDAAYLHEKHSRGLYKQPLPHLKDIFPNQTGVDVLGAHQKARALIGDTYEFGDRHIDAKFMNGNELLNEMQERHPGFSPETYQLALAAGCQAAR
jgi:hypothetical protein